MDVSLVFKLGGLGVVVLLLGKVMESDGKKDMAFMVELTGGIVGLLMLITLISKLFTSLKTLFTF